MVAGGHPNAQLIRGLFAAFTNGDLDTITEALDPEVRWHTPGGSVLGGVYVGRDAVLAQLARSGPLTDGTYRVEVKDVLASEARAVVLYRATGKRGGRSLDLDHLILYEIRHGRVIEAWATPLDLYAFDEFWGPKGA